MVGRLAAFAALVLCFAVAPLAAAPEEATRDPAIEDAQLNEVVFLDAQQGWAVGDRGALWHTTDAGAHWIDISASLPNFPTNAIVLDPRGPLASRIVYVGTDVGVYSSADGGATWARFKSGLPNVQVYELEIAPNLDILAAATYGRGVWEILVPAR